MKSSREKLFALIVGCLGVLVVGYFVYSWVAGQFTKRRKDIDDLQAAISKADRTVKLGRAAKRKLSDYQDRSLPANPEIALTYYQTWFVNEMLEAGLDAPKMRLAGQQGGPKEPYIKQSYQIDAKGTLPQVVDLLYGFYSMDWLHRITGLTLRPLKESKLLEVKMNVETLSLHKATSIDMLQPRPSNRLELASSDAYYDVIVGRNVFGWRNSEPKISYSGSLDVFLKRDAELTFKFEDPDPLDQTTFKLVESAAEDAKLDPETGKFTWTPKEEGKYDFVVEGTDDGFPAKRSNTLKFTVNVRPQNAPPPPAIFDFAKLTMLTALLDVDGQGEVWLHVRPTGQMVTLHAGDRFEIGSMKGTVSQIGEGDFCFDFEGKRRKLTKGEFLDQAKVVGDVPAQATSAEAPVQAKADSGT